MKQQSTQDSQGTFLTREGFHRSLFLTRTVGKEPQAHSTLPSRTSRARGWNKSAVLVLLPSPATSARRLHRSWPPSSLLQQPPSPKGSYGQASPSPFLLWWLRTTHTLRTGGAACPCPAHKKISNPWGLPVPFSEPSQRMELHG